MNRLELREARKRLGLTQAELAARLGLKNQNHISMMEKGKRGVSDRTVQQVEGLIKLRAAEFQAQAAELREKMVESLRETNAVTLISPEVDQA